MSKRLNHPRDIIFGTKYYAPVNQLHGLRIVTPVAACPRNSQNVLLEDGSSIAASSLQVRTSRGVTGISVSRWHPLVPHFASVAEKIRALGIALELID